MSGSSGYNSVLRVVSHDKKEDELREIGHAIRQRTNLAVSLQVISHVSASPWFPRPQPAPTCFARTLHISITPMARHFIFRLICHHRSMLSVTID